MKRKNLVIGIAIVLALVLAVIIYVVGIAPKNASAPENAGDIAAQPTEAEKPMDIAQLVKTVLELKDELSVLIRDVKKEKFDDAQLKIDSILQKVVSIRKSVESSTEKFGAIPYVKDQMENVKDILDLAEYGLVEIADPAILQLENNPLSKMKADGGINVQLLCDYLDFAESIMPAAEEALKRANALDLSLLDSDGKISGYLEMANELIAFYNDDKEVFSTLKAILGAEEDRFYLLVAQNSAEIRASGGFPGSIGTIKISNGLMKIGTFRRVYNVMHNYAPREANITRQENLLFHRGLRVPRDADYCPDFDRVAQIWAYGYEIKMKEHVDGVISMTPVIIQRLLKAMGKEVELSDGTVLTGDNATRILQYEIYLKYYGSEYVEDRGPISDKLFAETAKVVLDMVTKNLSIRQIPKYLKLAKEGFEDRTIMIWMEDETEQNLMCALNCDGGLTTDPMKPEAGIYYSGTIPSKLGWYLEMDTEMGERVKNEDGSYTYPITITLGNIFTEEDLAASDRLLTGGYNGKITGTIYMFAPAEGTVTDFAVSKRLEVSMDNYHNLQLGYIMSFDIQPGEIITITYHVTTAPGAEEMLVFSKTPTLQAYH